LIIPFNEWFDSYEQFLLASQKMDVQFHDSRLLLSVILGAAYTDLKGLKDNGAKDF
jgi:hypothetical protein